MSIVEVARDSAPGRAGPPALRPYQLAAADAVCAAFARNRPAVLIEMATGLGKTITFAEVARRLGRRTLVLAHREELLAQARDKIGWVWPDVSIGIVQGSRNEADADVVVASIQTLSRPGRLERLGRFGLVVLDECHHAPARTYRELLRRLRAGTGEVPLLGVTATPERADGAAVGAIFGELACRYDLAYGIAHGYLADLSGQKVLLALDLDQVEVRGGDLDEGDLGRAMAAAGAPAHIARAWAELAKGRRRRTLGFLPTIALAQATATELAAVGARVGVVTGEDGAGRAETLRAFGAGELEVVLNCGVLVEGYDEPAIDCVLIARPTRSKPLYAQIVGRGCRKHPEKTDCLVIDMTGEGRDLVGLSSLLGLREPELARRVDAGEARAAAALALDRVDADGELRYEALDLLAELGRRELAWVGAGPGIYALSVGSESVLIEQDPAGEWSAAVYGRVGGVRQLVEHSSLELAQGIAEDYVRANGVRQLVSSEADWRKRPPSARQLDAARRWGVVVEDGWSAGEVSAAIDARAAISRRNRARRGRG